METETIFIWTYKDIVELDFDGIKKLCIISISLGYRENKWNKYNRNKTKYIFGYNFKNKKHMLLSSE